MADPIDELLTNTIGSRGRYQVCITFLVMISRGTMNWHPMLVVLVAPPVGNFTCLDPAKDKCADDCPAHVFDHRIWERTIVHEWDLVCNKNYIPSAAQSIVISGLLFGEFFVGTVADRYGRRPPITIGFLLFLISSVSASFASYLWLYIVLRWISTVSLGFTMMPCFSLLMEFTESKYRSVLGVLSCLPSYICHALMGLIGYYCRRWNHIQLIVTLPWTILLLFWCILPESPRWLLVVGKTERLIKTLECGAKWNKLPTENIRAQVEEFIIKHPIVVEKSGSWSLLYKSKRMRTKIMVCIVHYSIIVTEWFAIAQYMGRIGGDVFWNISATGLVQVGGNFIACVVAKKVNRRPSIMATLILCTIPMYLIAILLAIPSHPEWSIAVMGCFSMLGCSMCWALTFVYCGELLPTVVRVLGLGISSTAGRCGAMLAPFMMETTKWAIWFPPLLFGTFPVISIIIIFIFSPETKGRSLPSSVADADEI